MVSKKEKRQVEVYPLMNLTIKKLKEGQVETKLMLEQDLEDLHSANARKTTAYENANSYGI